MHTTTRIDLTLAVKIFDPQPIDIVPEPL